MLRHRRWHAWKQAERALVILSICATTLTIVQLLLELLR
jgi:hypothetical protein